jgi:outer membrane immunogenic protein
MQLEWKQHAHLPFSAAAIFLVLPAAANAQDAAQWVGPYAGLAAATNSGDMLYNDGGAYDLDGNNAGLIFGYNVAQGPWVFGAELAYSKGRVEEVGNPDFAYESWTDLKARAGYAFDNVLVYGTLGATFSTWDEGGDSFDGDGLLIGIGVDYLVSPSFFVGSEFLVRDMKSDWNASGDTLDADVNTFGIRAGMKF